MICDAPYCRGTAIARGLCRRHYDHERRYRFVDELPDLPAPWCECDTPDWEWCGPLFPAVRQCRRCGSPDRTQLGRWPGQVLEEADDGRSTMGAT